MKPFKPVTRVPSGQSISSRPVASQFAGPPPAKKRRISQDDGQNEGAEVEATIAAANVLKRSRPVPQKKFVLKQRTPLQPVSSNGNNSSSQTEQQPVNNTESHFFCTWRKHQTKKNKTWDGDGVVSVKGTYATLRNDDGKPLGSSVCRGPLLPGSELSIGGKDVEIGDMIPKEDFIAGRVFLDKNKSAPPPSLKDINGTKKVTNKERSKQEKIAATQKDVNINRVSASKNVQKRFAPPVMDKTSLPIKENTDQPGPRHTIHENSLVMNRPTVWKHGQQIVDVVMDPYLTKSLREHQREGVKFLYDCVMGYKDYVGEGAILADEMGLGKTLQTIALIWTLLRQNPIYRARPVVRKALIVCPVTLMSNWRREFHKWLGGKEKLGIFMANGKNLRLSDFTQGSSYHVCIIGYEKLTKVQKELADAQGIDLIVCDEGHRLKTAKNKAAAAIKAMSTQRRIILSGTPIQNDLEEFFQMVDFVNPSIMSKYSTFKREFEVPILKSRQPEASAAEIEKGAARSQELASRTGMFILRRTADLLSQYLPAKTEYVVLCRPTKAQARIYRAMVGSDSFLTAMSKPTEALGLINVLKKVCNCPKLLLTKGGKGDESTKPELLQGVDLGLLKSAGASGKLQVLDELLHHIHSTTDEKVVIVSNYTSTLDVLGNLLTSLDYRFLRLDGTTPQVKRQEYVERFNRSPKSNSFAFLLSAKAGGMGINLIGASRLIMFDIDWNPATDAQAMARVHRDGQKRPCFIYRLLTQGALDEKIFQRQITKTGLADAIVDGKSAASGFTQAELREIFTFDEGQDCQTHRLLGCDCGGKGIPLRDEQEEVGDDYSSRNDLSTLAEVDDSVETIRMDGSDDEDIAFNKPKPVMPTAAQVRKEPAAYGYGPDDGKATGSSAKGKMLSLMQYTHFDTALVDDKVGGLGIGPMESGEDDEEEDMSALSVVESAIEDEALRKVICDKDRRVGYVFTKLSS